MRHVGSLLGRCAVCALATHKAGTVCGSCGGAGALVGLLAPGGSADLHQDATGVLVGLTSESGRGREAVRACGGAAALEGVLACAFSAAAHEWAAAALRNLGPDVQQQEPH